jgi:hypothetical protein
MKQRTLNVSLFMLRLFSLLSSINFECKDLAKENQEMKNVFGIKIIIKRQAKFMLERSNDN